MSKKAVKSLLSYLAILAAGIAMGYLITQGRHLFKPDYVEGNYATYFPDKETQVVLYGTQTCPYCADARQYLRQKNVAFADLDLDASDKNGEDFRALDGKGVPLILIGNRKISGFNPSAIDDALANNAKLARQN